MSAVVESSPLPSRHAVRSLVEGLIGRDVEISDGIPVANKSTNVVAVYVNDHLGMQAVMVIDIELAARFGGALGMVPRGGVDDAIQERNLPPVLRDNCYEVLNVMASVFNVGTAPHVKLYEMYGPNAAIPGDVAGVAASPANRMDVKLTVAGYGPGNLSIIIR